MIKAGVSIAKLTPQALLAFAVAQPVFAKYGYACILTAGDDGKHKANSKHYTGEAIDLRSKHIPTNKTKGDILIELKVQLGDNFDVLLESLGDANEHFHIEYDPKPKPKPQAVA